MSHFAGQVSTLLVEEYLGELYSHIFATLLQNGRLPLPRLTQLSRLTSRQIKHGLWVLIQHSCVYNYSSVLDPTSYYEANWKAAYNLSRTGKATEVIHERFGDYAKDVVAHILNQGQVRVGELEKIPGLVGSAKFGNGVNGNGAHVNGVASQTERSHAQLHATLRTLANDGFITRVREYHVRSPADSLIEATNMIKDLPDMKLLKGKKFDEVLAERVRDKIQEWSDGSIPLGAQVNGLKRKAGLNTNGSNKRARLDRDDDDMSDEGSEDDADLLGNVAFLDPDIIIRVNHEKLPVRFRHRSLVRLAEKSISRTTSRVYDKMLQKVEGQIARCQEPGEPQAALDELEFFSPPVPVMIIAKELDLKINLVKSVGRADPSRIDSAGLRRLPNVKRMETPDPMMRNDSEEEEEIDEWAEDDNDDVDVPMPNASVDTDTTNNTPQSHSYVDVEKHLFLLSEEPHSFTNRDFRGGIINWNVEYRHLTQRLRQLAIEQIIQSKFGTVAVRIIRALHRWGKLDEKRLQQLSLVASKDLRILLGRMQKTGLIDLQEVPRDNQRMPARTLFLWFYDADRVRKVMIEDTYKSMTKHLRRLQMERENLKPFLEKAERTDVKGHEEEFLSAAEMETLNDWRTTEDLLLLELARLDDVIMVLRDY